MNPEEFLSPGLARTDIYTVKPEHTAVHLGSGMVKVLSTPTMILFTEITTRLMLDEHLPEGYSSEGTRVDVRHLSAAKLGSEMQARTEIMTVDGNRVTLAVEVTQGETIIGSGQHERYVIEVARFLKRFEE